MIENIKIYSKIAAKSFLKWLLIIGGGILLSTILFFIVLYQNIGMAGGGHGNVLALLVNTFSTNFPAFLLIVGFPLFIFFYIMIANKYFIQSSINQIWKNKAEAFVGEKIKNSVEKLVAKNDTINSISNASVLRLKLLEENRTNPESSKIKRKIVDYIIKKIKLDDIEYSKKDLRLSDIVVNKVNNFISESAEPSLHFFWILFITQIVIFIIAQFL